MTAWSRGRLAALAALLGVAGGDIAAPAAPVPRSHRAVSIFCRRTLTVCTLPAFAEPLAPCSLAPWSPRGRAAETNRRAPAAQVASIIAGPGYVTLAWGGGARGGGLRVRGVEPERAGHRLVHTGRGASSSLEI